MIVQPTGGGLLVFRQTDHALLSAAFAASWGNGEVAAPPRREATLVAAARHDDGWADWELVPRLTDDGRPIDFIGIPVDQHVELYRHGIDMVEAEDLFAGLVASLHGQGLYSRPFHPGWDPRIDALEGEPRRLADAFVAGEGERQARLIEQLGDGALTDAEEAWRLLQVWDRLSLLVCMHAIDANTAQTFPPFGEADTELQVTGTADGDLLCTPFPFDGPAHFEVLGLRLDDATWPDETSYRRAYRAAPPEVVSLRCLPG